jgi:hypothetical protein
MNFDPFKRDNKCAKSQQYHHTYSHMQCTRYQILKVLYRMPSWASLSQRSRGRVSEDRFEFEFELEHVSFSMMQFVRLVHRPAQYKV